MDFSIINYQFSIAKAKILLISAAFLWSAAYSYACTSIIVSGKVTPDGRPYIFKNRDTHDQNNLAIQLQGSRYRFIAIVAAKDSLYKSVWSCVSRFLNIYGRPSGVTLPDTMILVHALEYTAPHRSAALISKIFAMCFIFSCTI